MSCLKNCRRPSSLFWKLYLLLLEGFSPKLGCICLCDSESVSLEESIWKYAFQFCQHVAEDQRQFGQVAPARTGKHLFVTVSPPRVTLGSETSGI